MNWKIKKSLRLTLLFLAVILILASAGLVLAMNNGFTLSWSSIDGGGGKSRGAGYVLGGTASQPDAGILSSREYTFSGGFWPGLRPQPEQKIFMPVALK